MYPWAFALSAPAAFMLMSWSLVWDQLLLLLVLPLAAAHFIWPLSGATLSSCLPAAATAATAENDCCAHLDVSVYAFCLMNILQAQQDILHDSGNCYLIQPLHWLQKCLQHSE